MVYGQEAHEATTETAHAQAAYNKLAPSLQMTPTPPSDTITISEFARQVNTRKSQYGRQGRNRENRDLKRNNRDRKPCAEAWGSEANKANTRPKRTGGDSYRPKYSNDRVDDQRDGSNDRRQGRARADARSTRDRRFVNGENWTDSSFRREKPFRIKVAIVEGAISSTLT
ncbi:hypothetical protein N7539_004825 [Penicillium diatomitis]|uniref:Uncharacterized protein n=1 Tax=Penicillium diatomitis TaxID=2819901 RepID=A0A9W9X5T2_9EURO|nr:uncharacterized protein N7539_004825 [Penicillium diatomitis]KAJ5484837.1 hypothetical protein N7539_004825 [Penicillium diatomitis]